MNTPQPPPARSTSARSPSRRPAPNRRPRGYLRIGSVIAVPVRGASVVAAVAMLALIVAVSVATLTLGRLGIAPGDLLSSVFGGAEGKEKFVLNRLRGPRLAVCLGAGTAFGLSGALFQAATRNPLASPDVIGLSSGAGAGAAIFALALPGGTPVWIGALLGASAAMGIVYLTTGTGFRDPARLVVAGIGVAAIGTAITQYVVYVVERDKASALSAYVNGSVAARSWDDAGTIGLVLLVVAGPALILSRHLDLGEMGDDVARSLGGDPGRTRTLAVVLAVVLSAGAVTVAGPIAFIALTAPQIARRLTRGSGPHLVSSALVGALLLTVADLAAQQLPWVEPLPVGIYTLAFGGVYLGYLLTREWRSGRL
ncbi:iron chelate uptake ABC transporter family permease subunit [Streptomyces sp. SID3343]|uniref:FecCD family ABC transporter permease n=1 Tax=Streptomyces sp. SID3343 TaxID=2690260 RepID=UPI00136C22C0|nr:iron chelate uptake ABC transporter family permease subunit [Streptomyces sp. SID3343]MYW00012.1 iron chelate uptake ABC transporter family permease subunit [Streptomyces sp. SID3343]